MNVRESKAKDRHNRGQRIHTHKLTDAIVRRIRDMERERVDVGALASKYNVSRFAIWNVLAGRTWKHLLVT